MVQLYFTHLPFENEEFMGIIQDEKSWNEFRELFGLPDNIDDRNFIIEIPMSQQFDTNKLNSVEIRKIFKKYSGRRVFISMNNDAYNFPPEDEIYKIKI